jgi:hypothetical protein
VAIAYGVLMVCHVVFGLFFALTFVCVLRGAWLFVRHGTAERLSLLPPLPAPLRASA